MFHYVYLYPWPLFILQIAIASSALCQLLVDKDTIVNAVTTSHDLHLLKIDNREDEMNKRIHQWQTALMEETHDREETARNRTRVMEINHLIDHLRDEIENVELAVDI